MIPIVKGCEPAALAEAKRIIRNTPDATFCYESLRGGSKRKLLEALLAEQGHLCAYCMCRIGTDGHPATIEHLIPQHPTDSAVNGELSLAYHNLVAVCDGRGGATCDKRRGNASMTVDPTKRHTLDSIYYHRDGRIDATDESIQHDIQTTLGLNNSRTNLCANRFESMRAIEKVVTSTFRRRGIENNRSAKKMICLKILKKFESQTDMKDEYLGAKLFVARKLVSKFD
ncbi:hypothetical protein [Collinsella aerofaciens]|uniref:hypothetical protein n=1 Tax=Collinsella aerofaciens TaxID=74426 RepID=UPI00321A1A92